MLAKDMSEPEDKEKGKDKETPRSSQNASLAWGQKVGLGV